MLKFLRGVRGTQRLVLARGVFCCGDWSVRLPSQVLYYLNSLSCFREDQVLLGQGTLRPDLIESASSLCSNNAATIKTHHNDTELVRALRARGRVVEPLRDFHKDEVGTRAAAVCVPATSLHQG